MTMGEVLVVLALMGIGLGVAAIRLDSIDTPLRSGSTLVEGFLREARLNAIATTSAYRVSPDGTAALRAEHAASCSATSWTPAAMELELPQGVAFDSTSWSVCFGSRGISSANVVVTLTHPEEGSVQVEVLVGGTTRVVG
jgi:hypothetical protein